LGVTEGCDLFSGECDAAGGSAEQGEEQVHQNQVALKVVVEKAKKKTKCIPEE
jgi:hypothetical protein